MRWSIRFPIKSTGNRHFFSRGYRIGNIGNLDSSRRLNIGEPDASAWLFCDLCSHGRTLIRQGWREGLPKNKPPAWIFCPLERGRFPRDRRLVEECRGCTHYKGVGQGVREAVSAQTDNWEARVIYPKTKLPELSFTREELEQARRESEEKDRKWREDRDFF